MDKVTIIMGSISDRETMEKAAEVLDELGISYEIKVLSAHWSTHRDKSTGRT